MLQSISKKLLFLLILMVHISVESHSQSKELVMSNSVPIDPHRYDGIKGTPYLYENWMRARIANEDGQFIDSVWVNFNGDTQQIEVREANKYIQLDENLHPRVIVLGSTNQAIDIFIKFNDSQLEGSYVILRQDGKLIDWISSFSAKIKEKKVETPGKTVVLKRFSRIESQYFIIYGELIRFKLKKKSIIGALQDFPTVPRIIEQNNLDMKTIEGLQRLLESLGEK